MKQTAVEWLFAELKNHLDMPSNHANELLELAKEMEKEQSVDFARLCLTKAKGLDILSAFMNTQQYYNETFNTK